MSEAPVTPITGASKPTMRCSARYISKRYRAAGDGRTLILFPFLGNPIFNIQGVIMSFQAMAWAVKQIAPTKSKFTLLILANYADDQNKAWPSLATLSRDTGIKRSTLIESLNKLVELSLISKVKRFKGSLRTSNAYVLNVPQ